MKTAEEVVRRHAVGPINIYQIYQEGYQDRELDDCESFRREAAKDILCAMIQAGVDDAWKNVVPAAIEGADVLIAKLKEK